MDDRAAIAWLGRRIAFGLAPGELDQLTAAGVSTTLDRWLEPSANGVPAAADPWADVVLAHVRPYGAEYGQDEYAVINSWLRAMITTPRPFEEWMRWFWHGHFVSTLGAVRSPWMLRDQLRMFGALGLGDFPSLLRAVTVDHAMLIYLNGMDNEADGINENYAREVLELFTLGIGHYSQADVRAGATALTGYRLSPLTGVGGFLPKRHDDTPQTYLGRTGVHDVDTVVDAIVNHPACGPFLTGELARAVLGPAVAPGLITSLAKGFVDSGLQLRPLMRAIVEAGVEDGASTPLILGPVRWATAMARALRVTTEAAVARLPASLRRAGQVPLAAPNVGGWPGGTNWLSASATIGRYELAGVLAVEAPETTPAWRAATRGNWATLADHLGHPEGFSTATRAVLGELATQPQRTRLALALAAPELVLA